MKREKKITKDPFEPRESFSEKNRQTLLMDIAKRRKDHGEAFKTQKPRKVFHTRERGGQN